MSLRVLVRALFVVTIVGPSLGLTAAADVASVHQSMSSAFESVGQMLATRFGVAAIDAVHDEAWGTMVALQAGRIARVPLSDAVGELKLVDPELYGVAQVFFE